MASIVYKGRFKNSNNNLFFYARPNLIIFLVSNYSSASFAVPTSFVPINRGF